MTEAVSWVKWRFDKWRNDPGLRRCSLAARGLWMELLCVMHEGTPYGHLAVNMKALSERDVMQFVGSSSIKEVKRLLNELRDAGVFSETSEGVIYCRRLVRDQEAMGKSKAYGKSGGNPALKRVNPTEDVRVNGGVVIPLKIETETETETETDARAGAHAAAFFEGKGKKGHRSSPKMPNLNSPWSAWEWLTGGEIEVCGPNAQRRPCAGGFYVDEVARLVAEAAMFNGHTEHIDWRPMVGWLKAGYDSVTILDTIKRIASKPDYEPKTNLKYFTPALVEASNPKKNGAAR